MPQPAGLLAPSQQLDRIRWGYRYRYRYYRSDDGDERQPFMRRETPAQAADPVVELLRSNARRGGRWLDPPPPH